MSCAPYEALIAATAEDQQTHILENELIKLVAAGGATLDQYVVYLRETFHLVKHTSRALALAASRVPDEQRRLRAWLLEQASEEHGHELFCVKDIQALGLDASSIVGDHPGPGAWGLVTQNYYLASQLNPVGILGVASATEGMGAELAAGMAMLVQNRLGVPPAATTFLRSHSAFDVKHLEEAKSAINTFGADEEAFSAILHARKYTFRFYGQLFRDVAESTARFFDLPAQVAA